MGYMRSLLALHSLGLVCGLAWGGGVASAGTIVLSDPVTEKIGGQLDVLEDTTGELALADVQGDAAKRFEPVGADEPNYGFTDSTFWFRGTVANPDTEHSEWMLESGYPLVDSIEVFAETDDGRFTRMLTGDRLPFAHRPVLHRNFVFPLEVPPGQTRKILMRVQTSSSVQLPMSIWEREAFFRMDHRRELVLGLFLGLLGVMAIYNLFLWTAIRERNYLYYVTFVTSTVLWYMASTGVAFQMLWPDAPALANKFIPFIVASLAMSAVFFAGSFLDFRRHAPRVFQFNRVVVFAAGLAMVLAFVAPYGLAIRLAMAAAFASATVNFVGAVVLLVRGHRSARFFVLAWTAFLVGTIVAILSKAGLLPRNLATEYSQHVGSVLEVVLLSFALADRINQMKSAVEHHTRELREKNETLGEQAEVLKELDDQRTQFFQNISHELRTPLTLILNPLESMAADPAYADEHRLHVAVGNSRRLLRLVNQLLDFQKLSAGQGQLTLAPMDLVEFARSCGTYYAPACRKKKIQFQVLVDGRIVVEGAPLEQRIWVNADRDAMEKVLFNYLSNALKFTPEGRRIELRVEKADGHGRLSVVDEGPGLSTADQARLFHVFAQAEDLVAHQEEGTGLGLALARELTEAMGGQVGVDSAPGEGSRFWAVLPVTNAPAELPETSGSAAKDWYLAGAVDHATDDEDDDSGDAAFAASSEGVMTPADTDRGYARELILVVDDLADMRRLIRDALKKQHYRVATAINGEQALARARELRPDLIISDWMMPIVSGPEFVQNLRKDPSVRSTPVVLLTAKSDEASRMLGTELGADAFVGKPFHSEELTCVVRNLLQLKAGERRVEELNRHLSENVLKRYLAPSLVEAVLEGRVTVDQQPKSVAATVLFSELTGFGKATTTLRAPQMARMLNDYLSTMSSIVLEHGGTIDKFIGDTIMVLFGAPVAQKPEEQVQRAAACASAMQAAMPALHASWERRTLPCLQIRVAAHHGPVVVGNFGDSRRYDYTAIGPSVNLAARLLTVCDPGEVFVSAEVYDLLPETSAQHAGNHKLKGIDAAVPCYRLVEAAPLPVTMTAVGEG